MESVWPRGPLPAQICVLPPSRQVRAGKWTPSQGLIPLAALMSWDPRLWKEKGREEDGQKEALSPGQSQPSGNDPADGPQSRRGQVPRAVAPVSECRLPWRGTAALAQGHSSEAVLKRADSRVSRCQHPSSWGEKTFFPTGMLVQVWGPAKDPLPHLTLTQTHTCGGMRPQFLSATPLLSKRGIFF